MKRLDEVSQNIAATAMQPGRSSQISSAGSGTRDMTAITTYQPSRRPTADEVPAILTKLHTQKPWQIKPNDRSEIQNGLRLLAWANLTATYDELAYWVGRTLSHFNRRDTDKDGVIISDLSGAAVRRGVSLCAAAAVLEEIWIEAKEETGPDGTKYPAKFPPAGEILRRMAEKTEFYALIHSRLDGYASRPELPDDRRNDRTPRRRNMTLAEKQDMYGGRLWHEWTGQEQAEMEIYLKTLEPPYRAIFRSMYKIPEEIAA